MALCTSFINFPLYRFFLLSLFLQSTYYGFFNLIEDLFELLVFNIGPIKLFQIFHCALIVLRFQAYKFSHLLKSSGLVTLGETLEAQFLGQYEVRLLQPSPTGAVASKLIKKRIFYTKLSLCFYRSNIEQMLLIYAYDSIGLMPILYLKLNKHSVNQIFCKLNIL